MEDPGRRPRPGLGASNGPSMTPDIPTASSTHLPDTVPIPTAPSGDGIELFLVFFFFLVVLAAIDQCRSFQCPLLDFICILRRLNIISVADTTSFCWDGLARGPRSLSDLCRPRRRPWLPNPTQRRAVRDGAQNSRGRCRGRCHTPQRRQKARMRTTMTAP